MNKEVDKIVMRDGIIFDRETGKEIGRYDDPSTKKIEEYLQTKTLQEKIEEIYG